MPDNVNLHWTEDDDLLTQYVLGRLTEDEQEKLEVHLLSCLHCREAVRQEQELASGIRRYGREEVKSRLRRRLAAQSDSYRTLITWQRVLSAAAVVVVVAGIGIYNRWFSWGERKSLSTTEEMQEPQKALSASEHNAVQSKEKETSTARQQVPLKTSHDEEAFQKVQAEQMQDAQTSVAVPKTHMEQNEGMKKGEYKIAAPSSGGGAISTNTDLGNAQDQIMMAQPGTTQFWIEGVVLQEQRHAVNEHTSMDERSAIEQNMPKPRRSVEQNGRHPSVEDVLKQNEIRISQRNVHLLPIARQKLQQQHEQAIQTYVQRSDRGTSMTMYLDTLFSEEDLRNAGVKEIQPDSLVIEVESRKIGFKMPVNVIELHKGIQRIKQK